MDDTPIDTALSDLEQADPADAPAPADALADLLGALLDDDSTDADAPQA